MVSIRLKSETAKSESVPSLSDPLTFEPATTKRSPVSRLAPSETPLVGLESLQTHRRADSGVSTTVSSNTVGTSTVARLGEPKATRRRSTRPKTRVRASQLDEVVRALQQGVDVDRNFRRLFDHFYEPLQRFFRRRLGATEDRSDLVQETFLRIYRGIGRFRGECRISTWVFRIANNTLCRWLRRQRTVDVPLGEGIPGEMMVEDWLVDPEADPLADTLAVEQRFLLWRFVDRLPPQMRRCTILRVRQGLSTSEIAKLLALSPQTVKVHLHTARKKLQSMAGDAEVA